MANQNTFLCKILSMNKITYFSQNTLKIVVLVHSTDHLQLLYNEER